MKKPDAFQLLRSGLDLVVRPSRTSNVVLTAAARSERSYGEAIRKEVVRHHGRLEEWPAFVRELFARLWDEDGCEPLPDEARSAWGSTAVSKLEEIPEWNELRIAAQMTRSIAIDSTVRLSDAVSKALEIDKTPKDEQASQDPRAIEQGAKDAEAALREMGAGEEEIQGMIDAAAAQAEAAREARRRMDVAAGKATDVLHQAVRAAAKEATARAEAINATVGLGFSRDGHGSAEEACPQLIEQLRLDRRMAAILRMAGRMRDAARGQLARDEGRCDVVGVHPTGDVAKLTPTTLASLASGGLRGLSTMRDIMEGSAQGWDRRAENPKDRGDVAILVDRSGSMHGQPEVQARALAVAALVTALQGNRRVLAGSFAGRGDTTIAAAMPGDLASIGPAVSALCRVADGGTDVDHALMVAAKGMQKFPGGMRSPDVLVITDGFFPPVEKKVLKELGERRLFGVMIGCGGSDAHKEFHAAWDVDTIDEASAGKIVAAMKEPRVRGKEAA